MSAPYRRKSAWSGCVWVFILLSGVAGQILVIYLLHPYEAQIQGWVLLYSALPFIVALAIGLIVDSRLKRRRIQAIGAALEQFGLTMEAKPSDSVRAHVAPHIDAMATSLGLRDGVANVVWLAFNQECLVFEHEYTTGSGKSTQVHTQTVAAWSAQAEDPRGAKVGSLHPILLIRPRIGETRAIRKSCGEDVVIGDEEFDKDWFVYGTESTARTFLNQGVREMLRDSPRGESWFVGSHWTAVSYKHAMDAQNILLFVERLQAVLRRVGSLA